MRRIILPVLLAASLASIALAASDQKSGSFEALGASGVTGVARVNPMPSGDVQIHESLRGLQPNTEYTTRIYVDGACGSAPGVLIVSFRSNPAGNAVINERVTQPIESINSLSVQLASDNTLVACASLE